MYFIRNKNENQGVLMDKTLCDYQRWSGFSSEPADFKRDSEKYVSVVSVEKAF